MRERNTSDHPKPSERSRVLNLKILFQDPQFPFVHWGFYSCKGTVPLRRFRCSCSYTYRFFFFLLIPWIVFRCYLRYIRCIREVSHGKETPPPPAKGKTSHPRSLWYGTNRTYISNRKDTRQNNQHDKQDTCPTT